MCGSHTTSGTLTGIICQLTSLAQAVVPVLVALALLFFVWGLAQWILNMSDTDKHKEGKERMIWGLVALFVIMSVAGLVAILQATFFGDGVAGRAPNSQGTLVGSHTDSTVGSFDSRGAGFNNGGGSQSPQSGASNGGGDVFRLVADTDSRTAGGASRGGGGGGFFNFIQELFSF